MASQVDTPDTPIFFWREFEEEYGYMSQWFECTFVVDGVNYLHAEMWMMVQKARLFGDEETEKEMLRTTEPKKHQTLGRVVKGYDGKIWDQNKLRIVTEGNYHKFTKTKSELKLKEKLLATGDRELVEASPTDRIWGVGFSAAQAQDHREEWGQNLLGKAITAARKQIREEL